MNMDVSILLDINNQIKIFIFDSCYLISFQNKQ